MRKLLLLLAILGHGMIFGAGLPEPDEIPKVIKGLEDQLTESHSIEDSIRILENIADLKNQVARCPVLDEVYYLALKTKNYPKVCDVLRKRANISTKSDSILLVLLDRTAMLPDSPEKDETDAFIRMVRTTQRVRYGTPLDKQAQLTELLESHTISRPEDIYEQIVLLHAICSYINDNSQGELLSHYMDELGDLVAQLPENVYSIRNLYYVLAGMAYSENDEPEKAIASDKLLLQSIDSLEEMYRREGRMYRDFDGNRHVVYTRILANYESMKPDDIEYYYAKIQELAATDIRASATYKISPQADVFYAMYKKDYGKALEVLKKCIDIEHQRPRRRLLLRLMTKAALQVGDKEALLKASTEYNDILEEYLDKKYRERYHELQIIYDVTDMNRKYDKLVISKQESENSLQRRLLIVGFVSTLIMITFIIVLLLLNRKANRLAKTLAASNATLKIEGDNLRRLRAESIRSRDQALKANSFKADFIKNMSREVTVPLRAITEYSGLIVDCAESSQKKYLERFCKMVEINSELLNGMVNDMLSLSDFDTSASSIKINRSAVDLYEMCNFVVETTRHRVADGVEMSFSPGDQRDATIYVDQQRIQQILINLLVNSAKFTTEGSIKLIPRIDADNSSITFTVEDTGIGIPADRKEHIFERFYKLNQDTQGAGLGLTVSRMFATLMGGTLVLDTDYHPGARFILTIPLS